MQHYGKSGKPFLVIVVNIKIPDGNCFQLLKDIFPQNAVDIGLIKEGGYIYKRLRNKEKRLYAVSDRIGCMSQANVKYLLAHNPEISQEKVHVNPNSIRPTPADSIPANKELLKNMVYRNQA